MSGARFLPAPALLLLAFALVAAVALSLHAATDALMPFDRAVSDELQFVPGGRFYEPVANFFALGFVEYTVLFGAAGYAWRRGDRMLACAVVLVLVARVANAPLKIIIDRPRPDVADMLVRDPAPGMGFPSGHSSTVVLVYGYASLVALRHAAPIAAGAVVALSGAIVALIGWDRVWDGAHWPSDVLGGYASGVALLILAAITPPIAVHMWRRRDRSSVGHSEVTGLG